MHIPVCINNHIYEDDSNLQLKTYFLLNFEWLRIYHIIE